MSNISKLGFARKNSMIETFSMSESTCFQNFLIATKFGIPYRYSKKIQTSEVGLVLTKLIDITDTQIMIMSHLLRFYLHNRKRFNPDGLLKQHCALHAAGSMTYTVVKYYIFPEIH